MGKTDSIIGRRPIDESALPKKQNLETGGGLESALWPLIHSGPSSPRRRAAVRRRVTGDATRTLRARPGPAAAFLGPPWAASPPLQSRLPACARAADRGARAHTIHRVKSAGFCAGTASKKMFGIEAGTRGRRDEHERARRVSRPRGFPARRTLGADGKAGAVRRPDANRVVKNYGPARTPGRPR